MYKDKLGNPLSKGQVVVVDNKKLYYVEDFDNPRENFVKLKNSCIFSYNKPENLISVDSIHDLELLCKNSDLNG